MQRPRRVSAPNPLTSIHHPNPEPPHLPTMNNTFSEAAYRRAHAQANSKDPRSMMIAAHRDPVRISASQVPKAAKGGYDFMQAALSRPIQTQPPPQYRRVSAIPKPVQRKIIVHQVRGLSLGPLSSWWLRVVRTSD